MDKQQDKVSELDAMLSNTDGPWFVGDARDARKQRYFIIKDEDTWSPTLGVVYDHNCGHEKAREVAYLWAASPCMYEALKRVTNAYIRLVESGDAGHWNPHEDDEVVQAKAALSKANPNSNLTPSELRDKLDAVEVIGVVS